MALCLRGGKSTTAGALAMFRGARGWWKEALAWAQLVGLCGTGRLSRARVRSPVQTDSELGSGGSSPFPDYTR